MERAQKAVVQLQVNMILFTWYCLQYWKEMLLLCNMILLTIWVCKKALHILQFVSWSSLFWIFLWQKLLFIGVCCPYSIAVIFLFAWSVVSQGGGARYRDAWKKICEISRKEFDLVYQRLGVHLEEKVYLFRNELVGFIFWCILLFRNFAYHAQDFINITHNTSSYPYLQINPDKLVCSCKKPLWLG